MTLLPSRDRQAGGEWAVTVPGQPRGCGACGAPLGRLRADARFCGAACKQRAYRLRRADRGYEAFVRAALEIFGGEAVEVRATPQGLRRHRGEVLAAAREV